MITAHPSLPPLVIPFGVAALLRAAYYGAADMTQIVQQVVTTRSGVEVDMERKTQQIVRAL